MKKTLLALMFAFMPAFIFAQKNWQVTIHPADELQKTKEYTSYMYIDENGNNFVFWSNSKNVRIVNNEGIFDVDANNFIKATIGYYDINSKLIKKESKKFHTENDSYTIAEIPFWNGAKNLIKYLQENDGYVRILAPQYQKVSPWEIIVPCLNKEKNNI